MAQEPTKVKIRTTRRRTRKPSRRVIVTKDKTYHLSAEQRGLPIEDCYPGITLPKSLHGAGAKIYITPDGPVLAVPKWSR